MEDGIKINVKVELNGLEEELIAIGPRIAKRLLRRALTTVGRLWVEYIKSNTPVGDPSKAKQKNYIPGDLRNSINMKVVTGKNDESGQVIVGPAYTNRGSQDPGTYSSFVEFGLDTKNYPKQPFMRPVFDSTAERMIETFAAELREDLEEAIKK